MKHLIDKEIIILLIKQDMKHNQLLSGLEKIGLENPIHYLEILDIVGRLMGIPTGKISTEWIDAYMSFIESVSDYEIEDLGNNLTPLAEACYNALVPHSL